MQKRTFIQDREGLTINVVYDYFISWDRIDTREKLLEWVHHLSEKGWFTAAHVRTLIEIVCKRFEWRIYGYA